MSQPPSADPHRTPRVVATIATGALLGAVGAALLLGMPGAADRDSRTEATPQILSAARVHVRATGKLLQILADAEQGHGHPMSAEEKMLFARSVVPPRIRYTAAEDGSAVVADRVTHCIAVLPADPREADRVSCSGVPVSLKLLSSRPDTRDTSRR